MTHDLLYPSFVGMIAAIAGVGASAVYRCEKIDRVHRSLCKVLKGAAQAQIAAQGRAVGFHFSTRMMAVAWSEGAWCLLYRIDELLGLELVVDGRAVIRAFRGEPRGQPSLCGGAQMHVSLRLVFEDRTYPEFVVELWNVTACAPRAPDSSDEAIVKGARWIDRVAPLLIGGGGARFRSAPAEPIAILWSGRARCAQQPAAEMTIEPSGFVGKSRSGAEEFHQAWRAKCLWRLSNGTALRVPNPAWSSPAAPGGRGVPDAPPEAQWTESYALRARGRMALRSDLLSHHVGDGPYA